MSPDSKQSESDSADHEESDSHNDKSKLTPKRELKLNDAKISQMVLNITRPLSSSRGIFTSTKTSLGKLPLDARNNTVYNPPLTKVTSKLFIGSFEDAKDEAELRLRGITHIISCIGQKHQIVGIKHAHSPMNDHGRTDLQFVLQKLWNFIEESQHEENALFIHCFSGQNRSATLLIAILMKIDTIRLAKAFSILKDKRPVVQINENYAKQLTQLERDIFGRVSVPNNWMEISSFDMNTGSVVFSGDNLVWHEDFSFHSSGDDLLKLDEIPLCLRGSSLD